MNMLRTLGLLLPLACASAAWADADPGQRQAEQVAAFARLYGVVRYFHPGDATQEVDWNRFAVYGVQQAQAAPDRAALGQILRELFMPIAAGVQVLPENEPYPPAPAPVHDTSRIAWQHAGYADGVDRDAAYQAKRTHRAGRPSSLPLSPESAKPPYMRAERVLYPLQANYGKVADFPLGDGWKARVPLDLAPAEATITAAQRDALATLAARMQQAVPAADATPLMPAQREADVLVAWNVYRHFYPYWVDLTTDWDSQLLPLLRDANHPADRAEQRDTLRRLVALVQDGHGGVSDKHLQRSALPVWLEPIEGQIVITASRDASVQPGDRIVTIDGEPAQHWMERQLALVSGSPQFHPWQAVRELMLGPKDGALALQVERQGKTLDVVLHYDTQYRDLLGMTDATRPAPIAEVKPHTWYVDLSRVESKDLQPYVERLAHAQAIVFDMRGYPKGDIGPFVLTHLLRQDEHAKWMHVNRYSGPFEQVASTDDQGWDLKPAAPRFGGRIAFLCGGGAISYAESVLGYVADEHLATIVGTPSAGTNGNIQRFVTPSDYSIVFTGMRTTRHDGHSRYHLIGAVPSVGAAPTLAGFRAGHDEVLERALQVVAGR